MSCRYFRHNRKSLNLEFKIRCFRYLSFQVSLSKREGPTRGTLSTECNSSLSSGQSR